MSAKSIDNMKKKILVSKECRPDLHLYDSYQVRYTYVSDGITIKKDMRLYADGKDKHDVVKKAAKIILKKLKSVRIMRVIYE